MDNNHQSRAGAELSSKQIFICLLGCDEGEADIFPDRTTSQNNNSSHRMRKVADTKFAFKVRPTLGDLTSDVTQSRCNTNYILSTIRSDKSCEC